MRWLVLAILPVMIGCAGGEWRRAGQPTGASTLILEHPDRVLSAAVGVYQDLGIPVGSLEFRTGIIGSDLELFGHLGQASVESVLNCGGDAADSIAKRDPVRLQVQTLVERTPTGASLIRTRVAGHARGLDDPGEVVACTSTGWLEDQISNRLRMRLSGIGW